MCLHGSDATPTYTGSVAHTHPLPPGLPFAPGCGQGSLPSSVFDKAEEDRRAVFHERAVVR